MALLLSIITVLLFGLNYPIAEFIAPWYINPDANLAVRFDIYAGVMMFCFWLTQVKHNKWSKFFMSIGFGLCVSDVLDRFIFDVTTFEYNDILMIILTVLISYKKHVCQKD